MSIFGLGIDFVEINRIKRIVRNSNGIFEKRIFSEQEWMEYQYDRRPIHFLAKRFAAKEAASKALGIGMRNGLAFNQFEIFRNSLNKPKIRLLGKAKIFLNSFGIKKIHLSLSDEKKYAFAMVIMEK